TSSTKLVASATVLSSFERCQRNGYWDQSWFRHRMTPMQMLHESIRLTVANPGPNPGQSAGDHFVTLAANRGLDLPGVDTYRSAINHAAVADILISAIKVTEPWH